MISWQFLPGKGFIVFTICQYNFEDGFRSLISSGWGEVLSTIDRDQKKVETFARQMMDTLNKAAFSLMMSIGHQTGLFDIMADLPPSTSKQIATAAGLNERYVREWLGALVTGRIIDYEPSA